MNPQPELNNIRKTFNHTRFIPGRKAGHYESFFQRGNHPDKPLAFWIRYTVFSPEGHPEDGIGELWAVFFNGETGKHVALKSEFPLDKCGFSRTSFNVRISDSTLREKECHGRIKNNQGSIEWDLRYECKEEPLFNFPESMYYGNLPKAKALVGYPLSRFNGFMAVNGKRIDIRNWMGSQNHNWGSRHTDHYAWGQVAGFPGSPGTFLELATARLKIGPLWIPAITPIVLRHRGTEYRLNRLAKAFRRASFGYFYWDFHAEAPEIRLEGRITAKREDFVCLRYNNPPGGTKYCLNSKIAFCRLEIQRTGEQGREVLITNHGASFEILTDSDDHGMVPAC
jgi:hypothetical protein